MPGAEDYIDRKLRIIDLAERYLASGIEAIQQKVFKRILGVIKSYTTRNGNIDASDSSNRNILLSLNKDLKEIINKSTFSSEVGKYLKVFDKIEELNIEIYRSENDIDLTKLNLSVEKRMAIDEISRGIMNQQMIDHNFIMPVRKILYRHLTTGIGIKEAEEELRSFILRGDNLGYMERYVRSLTVEAMARYDGMINQKATQEFDLDAFRIVGSLIKTSMPVCIEMVNEEGRFEGLSVNGKLSLIHI